MLCLAHSAPHASHTSAHRAQARSANGEPRAISRAANEQVSAQLRSSSMHRVILSTDSSCKQAVAQCSHASMHSLHASMQSSYFSWAMIVVCLVFSARAEGDAAAAVPRRNSIVERAAYRLSKIRTSGHPLDSRMGKPRRRHGLRAPGRSRSICDAFVAGPGKSKGKRRVGCSLCKCVAAPCPNA